MTSPRPSTPPDVAEAAAIFGLGDVTGPAVPSARGELGRIWRLPTRRGPWALKEVFAPDPGAADDAVRDVAFQEIALAAGIPMPRPIVAPDGRVLVEVGPAEDRRWVRVYTWVDLRGPAAAVPPARAASILGRLHAIAPPDDRPVRWWYRRPPTPAELEALLVQARAATAPWADAMALMLPILAEALRAVGLVGSEPPGRVTCHLDFNPENVLVDANGDACVVDWENSGPAPLDQELACALAMFVRRPVEVAPFLHAYAAAGGPARLHGRSSFALTETVDANLIATYARRALEGADPEDRSRAAFWIGDIAANAVTLDRIDRWLEAARAARIE